MLSASNTVVSTIDYRNTGIILHVLPRVNSDGNVLLDIDQEISSAPPGSTTLTPTISQRKVQSSISVANGQTVLLAGLVSETATNTRTGAYRCSDRLPVTRSGIFERRTNPLQRTELIMFIRPQIHSPVTVPMPRRLPRNCESEMLRGNNLGSSAAPNRDASSPKRTR